MSDGDKCYAATPAETLEQHILDSRIAKNESEWWAHKEINRLRAENSALRRALAPFANIADVTNFLMETDKTPVPVSSLRKARAVLNEEE